MSEHSALTAGKISYRVEEGIGHITFFHPKSNSLPGKLLHDLAAQITASGKDPEVKVIVLGSEGDRAFCAGASFDELLEIKDEATGFNFFMGFARVINAARKCPKFILGRVQGRAVGGGIGLASSMDYCFALKSAEIKLSELAVGIGPFVVGPAVQRKIGQSAFQELAMDAAQFRPASWAHQKGLFMELFETPEHMDEALMNMARELAQRSPVAMARMKKIFWEGCEDWDTLLEERAKLSGELILTPQARVFLDQFKNK